MIVYAPLALLLAFVERPHLGAAQFVIILGSGALHLEYFVLLQRGYAVGDLSLVHPLARGTGPLLATTAAVILFGERPGPVALVGIGLITVGVLLLTGDRVGRWVPVSAGV